MSCESCNDYMMRYFDGDLNDIESAKFKQHLKTCKECNKEYEQLSTIFNVLETETGAEPPEDFESQVMKKVTSYELARKRRFEIVLFGVYLGLTAAMVALSALFLIGMKGVILDFVQQAGQHSSFMHTLYVFMERFYNVVEILKGILLQFSIFVQKLYPAFFAFAAAVMMIKVGRAELGKKVSSGE